MNIAMETGAKSCLGRLRKAAMSLEGWQLTGRVKLNSDSSLRDSEPTPVARNGMTSLLYSPLSLKDEFPDFTKRREIYRSCKHSGAAHVLVIVDAAEIRRVWVWERRRPGRPVDYRESIEPECLEDLTRLLRLASDDLTAGGEPESPVPAVVAVIARDLARRWRAEAGAPGPVASGPHLLEAIAGASDPEETWQVWRALSRIRIVDLNCGDGSWLLQASAELESLYAACLGRMAGWVLDSEHISRSGAGKHRDFRLLLARVENRSKVRSGRYILDRVILLNLHGVASCALDALVTRARLTRSLAATDKDLDAHFPLPETELRIVTGETHVERGGRLPRVRNARGSGLLARARECEEAFSIVRDLQLGGTANRRGLSAAYREIGKRRESLVARHRRERSVAGDESAARVAELYLHFPELLEHGRSIIVRG
jgi:hypothetical protein